ncbi:MAG: hypothetical protein MUF41_03245 [Sphingopyxis sp.]|jgi:hypothetical protein|nr:hypothetical protein [Sphingopyxis sp.]
MAMKAKISAKVARLRGSAATLRGDNRAVAAIEATITIPTLLFVALAGLETANLMITHTRISAIALSVADNASRIAAGSNLAQPQVREVDVNDVFTGAVQQGGAKINLQTDSRIILSSLETNAVGGQWIHWQRCFGNLNYSSAYGPQGTGATGTSFPGMGDTGEEVKAAPGAPIMFVEISYQYRPIVLGRLFQGSTIIDYEAAFGVRDARDTSNIFNPSPAATVRTCPPGGTPRQKRRVRKNSPNGNAWGWW